MCPDRVFKEEIEGLNLEELQDVKEKDTPSIDDPSRIEIINQEDILKQEGLSSIQQLKILENKKIIFKNEGGSSLTDNYHYEETIDVHNEPVCGDFNEKHLSQSEECFGNALDTTGGNNQGHEGRPFVFIFIDETIECTHKSRINQKIYTVLLGDRKYKVRKLYHDENTTIFMLIRSLIDSVDDVSEFMKKYKISQISGLTIHPLSKVSDLILRDNHIILSHRRHGSLGFDVSLRKKRKVFGLENLGNTCFMNSALQCILACNEFVDHFLLINRTLFDINRMPLTKAMHTLVEYGESPKKIISPVFIKQKLGERRSMYLEVKEQDAVEFITDLFDVIHEEIVNETDGKYLDYYASKVYNCKVLSKAEDEKVDTAEQDYFSWLNKNRSIITDLFFSKMKSSIICTKCKEARYVYEPSLILSVPVPGEGFYFEDIVLFYDSPQKVPLKIFAKGDSTVDELKSLLYNDYDFQYDVACLCIDSRGGMTVISDDTVLSTIVGALYCYEYRKEHTSEYYWVTIVHKTIWLSYYFDFNFLVRLEKVDEKALYDILKCRLTPFLDHRTAFMLYENIEQFFKITIDDTNNRSSDIVQRPIIRLDISNYNYKRLFGSGFSPLRSIIQLLSKPVTLNDCINLFLEKEYIFGREKKLCGACNEMAVSYKKLDFKDFPKYLIIQLKRFKFNGKSFEKLETLIDFPLDYIYVQTVKYKIVAISNHISSSALKNIGSNGHYTAYIKRDVWYYCNDHNVSTLTGPIDKKNAYIFFLERCT